MIFPAQFSMANHGARDKRNGTQPPPVNDAVPNHFPSGATA
jgi:hypothetical protein